MSWTVQIRARERKESQRLEWSNGFYRKPEPSPTKPGLLPSQSEKLSSPPKADLLPSPSPNLLSHPHPNLRLIPHLKPITHPSPGLLPCGHSAHLLSQPRPNLLPSPSQNLVDMLYPDPLASYRHLSPSRSDLLPKPGDNILPQNVTFPSASQHFSPTLTTTVTSSWSHDRPIMVSSLSRSAHQGPGVTPSCQKTSDDVLTNNKLLAVASCLLSAQSWPNGSGSSPN